ncbi:hypothetical protein BpHYR1_002266 [Brachionus plicatilis]|uniref:Uncharacterized protein n=1 Tax=Brachionus plicatilis TaxID=10195 RepID=A0A3M7SM05_BRAPC|nr:hypothetical protein BpHYR1_002266 [Brachionus plicatilis]
MSKAQETKHLSEKNGRIEHINTELKRRKFIVSHLITSQKKLLLAGNFWRRKNYNSAFSRVGKVVKHHFFAVISYN